MNISVLCRSCMKEVASWERENFDKRAIDMFCYCTNILITEDDMLPKQFCYNCFIKIESSYTFVKEAQKVNIIMKNMIDRTQTSVIIEADGHHKAYNLADFDPNSNASNFSLPDYELSNDMNNINHFDERSLFDNVHEDTQCHITKEDPTNIADATEMQIKYISSFENPSCSDNHELENDHLVLEHKNDYVVETSYIEQSNVGEASKGTIEIAAQVEPSIKQVTTQKDEAKTHFCAICRKSFIFQTWLDRHMAKEHAGCKFSCEHCPKSFSKQGQLASHVVCHSEERSFACGACGAAFKRRKHLAAHARSHSDLRPHACPHCAMRFKKKSVLKTHLLLHDQQKPHLCSVCGWSFAQAGNLEVHMRRHTGAKPYQCPECAFSCSVRSSLARHRRRHRAAPPHACRHCRRAFYDTSGLARHTRTHTGEQPYKCPYCARAFVDSWKRKSHLMRVHSFALKDIPTLPRDPGQLELVVGCEG